MRHHTPQGYGSGLQHHAIAKGGDGLLHVTTNEGVLEFDGVAWRTIPLPKGVTVRALAVDGRGTRWVLQDRGLGYLAPDTLGSLRYRSLTGQLPPPPKEAPSLGCLFPLPDAVLLADGRTAYVWRDGQLHALPLPGVLTGVALLGGEVLLSVERQGTIPSDRYLLYRYAGDRLAPLPLSGPLDKGPALLAALPHGHARQLLLVARDGGLWHYREGEMAELESEVGRYLLDHRPTSARMLPDSTYALSTLGGGLVLMDREGRMLKALTEKDGLPSDHVHDMEMDGDGTLWLAHSEGVSSMATLLPYTYFDHREGLEGRVNSILRHQGKLHVATNYGLYVLEGDPWSRSQRFHLVGPLDNLCMALLSVDGHLIVSSSRGIHQLSVGSAKRIAPYTGHCLYRSPRDPHRVLVGHPGGVSAIRLEGDRWQDEGELVQLAEGVRSLMEDAEGRLWSVTGSGEVYRIGGVRGVDALGPSRVEGLPKGQDVSLFSWEGDLWAVVRSGSDLPRTFRFSPGRDRFLEDGAFAGELGTRGLPAHPLLSQGEGGHLLMEMGQGDGRDLWLSVSKDGEWGDPVTRRVHHELFRDRVGDAALWDGDGTLWLGGGGGLVRYDTARELPSPSSFKALVRRVSTTQDSVISSGHRGPSQGPLVVPYSHNDLRFHFAGIGPDGGAPTGYRSMLEGFDRQWSPWTTQAQRDYTNLPEGDHRLTVMGRDAHGRVSEVGAFDLRVLPPWYRTVRAYLAYLLLLLLLTYSVNRIWSRKLRGDKRRLERVVGRKTAELQQQADTLRRQAEQLSELDRAKSRFIANVSHEFRTPLSLIIAPLEQAIRTGSWGDIGDAGLMHRNAHRVGRLIDQLLDLSRIQSGKLPLRVTPGDVTGFLRVLMSSFRSHAERQGIAYDVRVTPPHYQGHYDGDKLEKMVYNLLSNALKFTSPGGEVVAEATAGAQGLHIRVSDTGQGIPEQEMGLIFDRFQRGSQAEQGQQEGSGIGLALVRELVGLHRGTVRVESEHGRGSTFHLHLPLKGEDYPEEEISRSREDTPSPPLVDHMSGPHRAPGDAGDQGGRPLLLLVEDNDDLRGYLAKALGGSFQVVEAGDGEEGIAKALEQVPDVIVSDIMMPKRDGVELCATLKGDARTDHIPIILLTAKANIESRLKGLSTGADDYLTKPFHMEELSLRARNLHRQRRRLREHYARMVVLAPQEVEISSGDEAFLSKAMAVVERHMDDTGLTVPRFLSEMGMSRTQMHRKMRALTGLSTTEFIRSQRLKRAAAMIAGDAATISEICYQVGFTNLSYFALRFREQYGVRPSEYPRGERV